MKTNESEQAAAAEEAAPDARPGMMAIEPELEDAELGAAIEEAEAEQEEPAAEAAPAEEAEPAEAEAAAEEEVQTSAKPKEKPKGKEAKDGEKPADELLVELKDEEEPKLETKEAPVEVQKLAAELAAEKPAANWARGVFSLMQEEPELRVAFYRALVKKGEALTPEQQQELEAEEAIVPERPELALTEDKANLHYEKLVASGKEWEARRFQSQWEAYQQRKAAAERFKANRPKPKPAAEQPKPNPAKAQADAEVQVGLKALSKAFGKSANHYFGVRPDGVMYFKDGEFHKAFLAESRYATIDAPYATIARRALERLGRIKKPAAAGAQGKKPAGKQPLAPSPNRAAGKASARPGMVLVEPEIEKRR